MGKCLVGLGHLVDIFTLLHRITFVFGGGDDFFGELLAHRLPLLAARRANKPAIRERNPAVGTDLHRFFNDTATTEICALSLHDALPI